MLRTTTFQSLEVNYQIPVKPFRKGDKTGKIQSHRCWEELNFTHAPKISYHQARYYKSLTGCQGQYWCGRGRPDFSTENEKFK